MNREYLKNTLELVKLALSNNSQIPIFQCFCFSSGTVSSYNDTIAIVGPTEFEGDAGIHGVTLLGLLSTSQAEELALKLERDTAHLTLGKTVSKLPFQPLENFIFTVPKMKWASKVPFTVGLAKALGLCLETVSNDETQKALHGITVLGDKLYSCDGDSLTRVNLETGIGKSRYLLSTQFCSAVLKLWNTLEMTKGELRFHDEWIMADFGDWTVYGRVLEIQKPIDFEKLINDNLPKRPKMCSPPEGLSAALSRARVLADAESTKTIITVSKGKALLNTETHMGSITDGLSYNSGTDVVAHVNASHVQRALRLADQIAILENCVVFENSEGVFQLVSNMS